MTALLLVCGLVCEMCYLVYCDVVPLYTDVRVYGVHWPLWANERMGGLAFMLASTLQAWVWWQVRRASQAADAPPSVGGAQSAGARRVAWGWIGVFALTFTLQPGILSNDLHTYVLLGRMEAVHHVSPYEVPPVQMKHDPFQPAATAVGVRYTSRYGPAFQALSATLVRIAGNGVDAEFMVFRLAAMLAALLLVALADQLNERRLPGLILLGWCPLLWMQAVGDGHNEPLFLALVLLALVALQKAKPFAAGLSVGTAIAIKLTAIVPVGGLLWYLLHRDRRSAGLTVAGAVAAMGIWTVPYGLTGWNCLRANVQELNSVPFGSLPAYLHQLGLPAWLHPIAELAFAGVFAVLLWRAANLTEWIRVASAAALLFFLVVPDGNQEWYFLMPLALAAATPRPPLGFSILYMAALMPQALRDGLALAIKDVTLTCWSSIFLLIWLELRHPEEPAA